MNKKRKKNTKTTRSGPSRERVLEMSGDWKQHVPGTVTLDSIAAETGWHRTVVSRYLNGRSRPSFKRVEVLARAMRISISKAYEILANATPPGRGKNKIGAGGGIRERYLGGKGKEETGETGDTEGIKRTPPYEAGKQREDSTVTTEKTEKETIDNGKEYNHNDHNSHSG